MHLPYVVACVEHVAVECRARRLSGLFVVAAAVGVIVLQVGRRADFKSRITRVPSILVSKLLSRQDGISTVYVHYFVRRLFYL
jgi:hypothetical protein